MREYRAFMIDGRVGSPFYGDRIEIARDLDMTAAQDLIDSLHTTNTALGYHYTCAWQTGKLGEWMGRDCGGVRTTTFPHENKRNDTNAQDRSLEGDCEDSRDSQDVLRDRTGEQTQPEKAASIHLPSPGFGTTGKEPRAQVRRNPTFNSTHY